MVEVGIKVKDVPTYFPSFYTSNFSLSFDIAPLSFLLLFFYFFFIFFYKHLRRLE